MSHRFFVFFQIGYGTLEFLTLLKGSGLFFSGGKWFSDVDVFVDEQVLGNL